MNINAKSTREGLIAHKEFDSQGSDIDIGSDLEDLTYQ